MGPWAQRIGLLGLLWLAQVAWAGLPQPMCIYYGQALDGYGWPYTTNAQVVLRRGNQQIASHTIRGSLSPGVNFALNAHLDDGRSPTAYSRRAVRSGDLVSIVVQDEDGEKTIMESQVVPKVGTPGELIFINVTAAVDADGDQLPDAWEQALADWSDGLLKGIEEVHPSDDFDSDGHSNREEYLAGTFAFLDYDFFFAEYFERTPGGRFRISFLSVPGKLYGARSTTDVAHGPWAPSPLAASDTADFELRPIEGTGGWLSLYLPAEPALQFFRPTVETVTSYQAIPEPPTLPGLASLGSLAAATSRSHAAVLPAQPVLSLRRVAERIELSWPAGLETYQLQHNTDLNQPEGWATVTASIVTQAGRSVVSLPFDQGQQFFRLYGNVHLINH